MTRIVPHVVCVLLLGAMNAIGWWMTAAVAFAGLQAWFVFLDEVDPDRPAGRGQGWIMRLTRWAIGVAVYYAALAAAAAMTGSFEQWTVTTHVRAVVLPAVIGVVVLLAVMAVARLMTTPGQKQALGG